MKKHFKELDVWKRSVDLAVAIHTITKLFPKDEMYGLTSQLRRSAVSVPSNIAEGTTRYSDKETIQFLSIALGSLAECHTQLILAQKFGYAQQVEYASLYEEMNIIGKMINALRNKLKAV